METTKATKSFPLPASWSCQKLFCRNSLDLVQHDQRIFFLPFFKRLKGKKSKTLQ